MGRNASHTQAQVFEAAEQLAAVGQEVTTSALREILGRGSFSTLVKHIDAWQQARRSAPTPVILEMPESVKIAFAQCWAAAAGEAGKEIAAIREKSDLEIKTIKRRFDEAIAAIELLENEAENDTTRLEAAESSLNSERAASQLAATDAATRIAALSATVEQMTQQISAQQAEISRLHLQQEKAAEKIQSLAGRINEQQSELTTARAEAQRSNEQRQHAVDAVELAEQAKSKAERALEEANAREKVKNEEAAAAKTDALILTDMFEHQKKEISKLEQTNEVLDSELNAAHRGMQDQAEKLGKATGALESLRAQLAVQTDLLKGFTATARPEKKTK